MPFRPQKRYGRCFALFRNKVLQKRNLFDICCELNFADKESSDVEFSFCDIIVLMSQNCELNYFLWRSIAKFLALKILLYLHLVYTLCTCWYHSKDITKQKGTVNPYEHQGKRCYHACWKDRSMALGAKRHPQKLKCSKRKTFIAFYREGRYLLDRGCKESMVEILRIYFLRVVR